MVALIRCPYCFDELGAARIACHDCGTEIHDECFREHGRCVVFGCRPRQSVSAARPDQSARLSRFMRAHVRAAVVASAILGLIALACSAFSHPRTWKARAAKARADCAEIEKAAEVFKAETGHSPHALSDLCAKGILDAEPRDPWGDAYVLGADGHTATLSLESALTSMDEAR